MKILDRYVLLSFLRNYLIAFMVLVGMYVVLDMVFAFDEIVELKSVTGTTGIESIFWLLVKIADYYAHRSLMFFAQLSGIIPVVAAAFTLLRMSRFNELVASLAAGTHILRIAFPILIMGAIINLVFLPITQELIIPNVIHKLVQKHDDLGRDGVSYPVQAMQDGPTRLLNAGRFFPATDRTAARMIDVELIEHAEDLSTILLTTAKEATWDPKQQLWQLTQGERRVVISSNEQDEPGDVMPIEVYKGTVTPDEISLYRSGDYVELLSTSRINALLERPDRFGSEALLRVKHWRLTQPVFNIVLLWLAVTVVLVREPWRLKQAATNCLVLTGAAMGSVFLFSQFASKNPLGPAWTDQWPALMAFMPFFVWVPIAIWLSDRVRT